MYTDHGKTPRVYNRFKIDGVANTTQNVISTASLFFLQLTIELVARQVQPLESSQLAELGRDGSCAPSGGVQIA